MQIDDPTTRQTDLDEALATAAQYELPIKVRLQPQLRTKREADAKQLQYLAWRGVYWTVACDSVQEAMLLRRVLGLFFQRLGQVGLNQVYQALDTVGQVAVESAAVDETHTSTAS